METKFTPGPWKYHWNQTNSEADCGVFAEPHKGQAYSVCRAPRFQTKEQWEADARMIAAAPELLAALVNLLAVHECEGGTKYHAGDIARAAIAKATGASHD